ncbi:MAG: hypothetical protein ACOCV2_06185 [Persicimonas sp.]
MSADDSNDRTDSGDDDSPGTRDSGDGGGSNWPRSASDGEVLDPNLVDMEGPEEVDDGLEAAVANLRDARAEVHDEEVRGRRERRDQELDHKREEIELAVDPAEARNTSEESEERLLEPGPAHRGRRSQSRGRRGGLLGGKVPVWLSTFILIVAFGAAAGATWLHLDASEEDRTFLASFNDRIIIPIQDLIAGDSDRFSVEGVELVVEDLGWEPNQGQVVNENADGTQLLRRYRKGDERIQVLIYRTSSHTQARELAEERLDDPDRAIRLDTKVVEVVPVADTAEERVMEIIDRLEQFREMVEEDGEDA